MARLTCGTRGRNIETRNDPQSSQLTPALPIEEEFMDKDRIAGVGHQIKGAVKETVGKITGDAKTQAEGSAEKAAGKVQNALGGAKDAVRDTTKK